MTLSDSLNYSPYKLPNIRNHFGIAKYEILKSMSDMAKEENPNIHTLSNILEKFEEIYILWYNILFFINQIDEDIKNGRGQEWLTNPFYKSQMPKGEFETTKDYKIKIDNLLESDKKDVNLLKEDLSLLFHTEIKEFLSTHYELLLNIISSETQFLCTCHFHDNYDADTEWFKIKPYIKINSHSTFPKIIVSDFKIFLI